MGAGCGAECVAPTSDVASFRRGVRTVLSAEGAFIGGSPPAGCWWPWTRENSVEGVGISSKVAAMVPDLVQQPSFNINNTQERDYSRLK